MVRLLGVRFQSSMGQTVRFPDKLGNFGSGLSSGVPRRRPRQIRKTPAAQCKLRDGRLVLVQSRGRSTLGPLAGAHQAEQAAAEEDQRRGLGNRLAAEARVVQEVGAGGLV